MREPQTTLIDITGMFDAATIQYIQSGHAAELASAAKELYQDAFLYQNGTDAGYSLYERGVITQLCDLLTNTAAILARCTIGKQDAIKLPNTDITELKELFAEVERTECLPLLDTMQFVSTAYKYCINESTPTKEHSYTLFAHCQLAKAMLTSFNPDFDNMSAAA